MRLYLVRHGEADQTEPGSKRRLTAAGREQARAVARRLEAEGARPDAVLCSPLLRALETAALIAQPFGLEADMDERLGPGATADGLKAAVAGRGAAVLVVGHEPDFSQVVHDLTGGRIDLKKGGVAAVRLSSSAGELAVLLRPREIETLAG